MAIIRYCGSEPKVNQCLKHLLLLVGYKRVFFYVFFFPSLHFIWSGSEMSTAKKWSCCVIVAWRSEGRLNEVFVFLSLARTNNRVHRAAEEPARAKVELRGVTTLFLIKLMTGQ